MRCIIKGCNIVCRHPQKAMCWKEFGMCKYHAYELHPEIYEKSGYKPISSKFMYLTRNIH